MIATATAAAPALRVSDRCDVGDCDAQAFVQAHFVAGPLNFCGHHAHRFEAALKASAFKVVDERHRINAKSESSA